MSRGCGALHWQVFELETKMLINGSLYGNAIRGALPLPSRCYLVKNSDFTMALRI